VAPDLGPLDAVEFSAPTALLPGFRRLAPAHLAVADPAHVHRLDVAQYFSGVRAVSHAVPTGGHVRGEPDRHADALDSGITTIVDWSHNNNTPAHADAAIQAVFAPAIRAVWGWATPTTSGYRSAKYRSPRTWHGSSASGSTHRPARHARTRTRGPQFATKDVTLATSHSPASSTSRSPCTSATRVGSYKTVALADDTASPTTHHLRALQHARRRGVRRDRPHRRGGLDRAELECTWATAGWPRCAPATAASRSPSPSTCAPRSAATCSAPMRALLAAAVPGQHRRAGRQRDRRPRCR